MDSKFSKIGLALSIGLAASTASNAAIITIEDNFADPTLLSGRHNGTFDISSYLTPSENYNSPYQINSAAIMFSFSDDSDAYDGSWSRTTSSELVKDGFEWTTTRKIERYSGTVDDYESVNLNIEGAGFYDRTDYYETTAIYQGSSTENETEYHCSWGSCGSTPFHQHDFVTTYDDYIQDKGYTGDILFASLLDVSTLDDFLNLGRLDFNMYVSGDLYLNHAELVIDIDENPIVSVSEPGTLGLLSIGIAGLLRTRKKLTQ